MHRAIRTLHQTRPLARVSGFLLVKYLTVIPGARMGSESIAHEVEGQMGY